MIVSPGVLPHLTHLREAHAAAHWLGIDSEQVPSKGH